MNSSLAAKPSSSHECLAVLGWRRWGEGRGAGEGDGVLEGWEEGRREGRVGERGEIGCLIIATTGSRLEEVGGQMYATYTTMHVCKGSLFASG